MPAKVLRFRFPQEIIEQLETLKWWDWEDEKIRQNWMDFRMDIHAFYENMEEIMKNKENLLEIEGLSKTFRCIK